MKRAISFALISLLIGSFAIAAEAPKTETPKAMAKAELFGEKFDGAVIKIADAKPGKDAVNVGGTVTQVCQSAGCWLILRDGDKDLFVKSKGEKFFMPKNGAGAYAVAHGVVKEVEMSEENLKHFAKEGMQLGEIKGARKMAMLMATGVEMTPKEGQKFDKLADRCPDEGGEGDKNHEGKEKHEDNGNHKGHDKDNNGKAKGHDKDNDGKAKGHDK